MKKEIEKRELEIALAEIVRLENPELSLDHIEELKKVNVVPQLKKLAAVTQTGFLSASDLSIQNKLS